MRVSLILVITNLFQKYRFVFISKKLINILDLREYTEALFLKNWNF